MFENAQLEVPVGTLARGASQNAMTHKDYSTRLATEGRGGSRGLRPFRRGRGEDRRMRGRSEGDAGARCDVTQ